MKECDNLCVALFVENGIRRLVSRPLPEGKIDRKRPIADYGLDSLCLTLLLCELEQKLQIAFPRNISVAEFNSIESIIEKCNQELRCKDAGRK